MNQTYAYAWGQTPTGEEVTCYCLEKGALRARILNLGGIVYSLEVPDQKGNMVDVMLGFDTPEEYLQSDTYFGAIIGRYSNRIQEGRFELDGKTYELELNNGRNNLHSGKHGFHQYLFQAEFDENKPYRLVLRGVDEDMSQGFPGTLNVCITYELTEDGALQITYDAHTDKATPVNMTWHGYFNLDGHDSGGITEHQLKLKASHYTPFQDENMIPSGESAKVEGTPFDFSEAKTIGRDIELAHSQLAIGGGYDHNYVFDREGGGLEEVARAYGGQSGIEMRVFTDRPCMQLYTGNFIVTQPGKMGSTYHHRQGFCMETQTYPNAVNEKQFPSDILRPGERYYTVTRYQFL